jgi:hypothetical protein
MIGEPPQWALWAMVGLLEFMILLPIITSVSAHCAIVLPQTRASVGGGNAAAPVPVGSCRASPSAATSSGKY